MGVVSAVDTVRETIERLRQKGKLDGVSQESIDLVISAIRDCEERKGSMDGDGIVSYPIDEPKDGCVLQIVNGEQRWVPIHQGKGDD